MQEEHKKLVGFAAVDRYIRNGMVIGLGTGSTAKYAVQRVGEKFESGGLKDIRCVCTSEATRQQAESLDIPLISLDEVDIIDVAIDGADEVDNSLNLVKGRGAALLREKMVEQYSKTFIVVVDETKLFPQGLGTGGAMPVEITKFAYKHVVRKITGLKSMIGCKAVMRTTSKGDLLVTDNQNYIVDLFFEHPIADLHTTARDLTNVVGVVEHGLFLGMADVCLIGRSDASIETKLSQHPNANSCSACIDGVQ